MYVILLWRTERDSVTHGYSHLFAFGKSNRITPNGFAMDWIHSNPSSCRPRRY
jgi:hypothetical protein